MRDFLQKAKEAVKVVWNATKVGFTKAVKGLSALAGEALSTCEAKKAAADIQAQGALYNLRRQAMRELPVVTLNPSQAQWLMEQAYYGFPQGVGTVQLDALQSEQVFRQSLEQHCLDKDSRDELVKNLAPLVGIPTLMTPIHSAHKMGATELVLPTLNDIRDEKGLKPLNYRNIIEPPTYWGNNKQLHLRYNVHSPSFSEEVKNRYKRNVQNDNGFCKALENMGMCINSVDSEGVYLNITLKWVGA